MVLHLLVTYAALKIYPVNDLETGVRDFKIPIYHFKRHFKRIARHSCMRRGKAEFKPPVRSGIVLPARHKHELFHLLFNNMAERETNRLLNKLM